MKFTLLLLLLIMCSFVFSQEQTSAYKYDSYLIDISEKALIINDKDENSIDTLYKNIDIEFHQSENGEKYSRLEMKKLAKDSLEKYNIVRDYMSYSIQKEDYLLLSIVGPFISYSLNYYYDGGAHPSYGTNYITYNIETKNKFYLFDFFSKEELFNVLIKSEFILKYVDSKKVKNLDELTREFMNKAKCDYRLDFSSFSFGKFNGDKVLVNIGVTYDCQIARGNFEKLTLELSTPENVRKLLKISSKNNLLD